MSTACSVMIWRRQDTGDNAADAGTQTDVAMVCLQVFDGAGDGFAVGDQVPSGISPTAGGGALGFFALIVHTHGMAGCGGPGGRGDYPD